MKIHDNGRMFGRPLSIALAASLLALALLQLPLPFGGSLWAQTLENAAHAPLFGLLALLIHRAVGRRVAGGLQSARGYVASWLATVGIGAVTEIAQGFMGRDAAVIDLANDAFGAAFALAAMAWWRAGHADARADASPAARRTALAIAVLAALPVIAPGVMPSIRAA